MESITLTNLIMKDGSRHFLSLPEHQYFINFCNYLKRYPEITVTDFLSDKVTEVWIDFTFNGHEFSVNNQNGQYWFFVKDPNCSDDILLKIAHYCHPFLSEDKKPEKALFDPGYKITDFKRDLTSGSLRWLATILATANICLLVYLFFDPQPAEIHFPIHLKGKSAFVLLFVTFCIWTILSIVNWKNYKKQEL